MLNIDDTKIGLGILSWKGRKTLLNTLESYKKGSLMSYFDSNIIYFNSIENEDIQIAKKYNLNYFGSKKNIGIHRGMNGIIDNLSDSDYILFLQQDCPLCEFDEKVIEQNIQTSVDLLKTGEADIVRLRSRFNVGEGFADVKNYLRYYPANDIHNHFNINLHPVNNADLSDNFVKRIRRFIRPFKAQKMQGRAVYIEKSPEKLFPKYIKKIKNTHIVDSRVINFTEQPFLISKDLIKYIFNYVENHRIFRTLNGMPASPEMILNSKWWKKQQFKIAVTSGIFTHKRIDDSFRSNSSKFNPDLLKS